MGKILNNKILNNEIKKGLIDLLQVGDFIECTFSDRLLQLMNGQLKLKITKITKTTIHLGMYGPVYKSRIEYNNNRLFIIFY